MKKTRDSGLEKTAKTSKEWSTIISILNLENYSTSNEKENPHDDCDKPFLQNFKKINVKKFGICKWNL